MWLPRGLNLPGPFRRARAIHGSAQSLALLRLKSWLKDQAFSPAQKLFLGSGSLSRVVGCVFHGHRLERGIELHKSIIHGAVGVVAGEAGFARVGRRFLRADREREIGPFFGEAFFVLDGGCQMLERRLVMASVIN